MPVVVTIVSLCDSSFLLEGEQLEKILRRIKTVGKIK